MGCRASRCGVAGEQREVLADEADGLATGSESADQGLHQGVTGATR